MKSNTAGLRSLVKIIKELRVDTIYSKWDYFIIHLSSDVFFYIDTKILANVYTITIIYEVLYILVIVRVYIRMYEYIMIHIDRIIKFIVTKNLKCDKIFCSHLKKIKLIFGTRQDGLL